MGRVPSRRNPEGAWHDSDGLLNWTWPRAEWFDGNVTDVIRVDPEAPDPAELARAAECLRRGGLVAFPTETVYGLGVHALDRAAVRRLFDAKGRPANDPLIVHVNDLDHMRELVLDIPDSARELAARFWPGPLTMVVRRSPRVPDEVTAGLPTVAIRVPAHPVARALLAAANLPVAAPSANLFSRPSPTRASHVLDDLAGRIDLVVDGGPTQVGVESTVLDLSGDVPTILRPGAVSIDMLRTLLPRVERRAADAPASAAMPSPGLLDRHYSPRAPLTLFEGDDALSRLVREACASIDQRHRIGIMAADEDRPALSEMARPASQVSIVYLGSEHDLATAASRLYAAMRELDAAGVGRILVRGFPGEDGLAAAIRDRLRRASVRAHS
jgi:L-threonylcarbamoyladenylate synthase